MVCDTPFWVLPKAAIEKVPVPCGRCPTCKHRRVNSWVFRMMQEAKISLYSHFVTLTYNTSNVPISENGFMNLSKKDFQDYMKRLRKLCLDTKLKYYAVGEYGTQNKRPHYHAVIFGVPDPEYFSTAWQLGDVHVGTVTADSVAYTMKYIDKQSGQKLHARDDRQPEFPLMSKGLGSNYLDEKMVAYHKADISRLYATKEGGHKIALPRYYREKIYSETDKRQQLVLIQGITEKRLDDERKEFHRLYPPESGISFEQYQQSAKYGRYQNFYTSKKERNL